jgi:hypothetical protein
MIDPAYLIRLEEADRLRDDFALAFGVRPVKWSLRNLSRMLNATGERPERVAEAKSILSGVANGIPGCLGCGGAFDHPTMWARGRQPMMLVGHPYRITPDDREALDYLSRTFPTLRVSLDDRTGFYEARTNHVRVELVAVHRPFRNPPSTYKTRAAGRAARKAFAELSAELSTHARPRFPTPAEGPNDGRDVDDHL